MAEHVRMPAEWEPVRAILMALPTADTDWRDNLSEAVDCYRAMVAAFTRAGLEVVMLAHSVDHAKDLFEDLPQEHITFIEYPYNDTWTRDYGFISAIRGDRLRALDFGFNGWGLKFAADRDNLATRFLNDIMALSPGIYRKESDFILEGGSIESDGNGTILTTSRCLCSPNRNGGLSKQEASDQLSRRLGADHVLWLDHGALAGDDTDSHIDTLARLCPNDTIIYCGCQDADDEHYDELQAMASQLRLFRTALGDPYTLIELPLPDPIYDDEGNRLPATYANFLVANSHIFLPVYGQPQKDLLASKILKIAYPDHKVVSIDCRALIKQHGSLHCATMQVPEGVFIHL